MPDNYDDWYQTQIENGLLPNENGYYNYVYHEEESEEQSDQLLGV